jgi:hypothetical protein
VFDAYAQLNGSAPRGVQAVYRYDFKTEQLTWLSQPELGATGATGASATIAPLPIYEQGSHADIDDWNRAVSGCPEEVFEGCQTVGEHDGEDVIFTTAAALQRNDVNEATDVYLWHCAAPCENPATEGTVRLISDGEAPGGVDLTSARYANVPAKRWPAMSSSGRDIFFFTETALVPQDSDDLGDLYDARIGGGLQEAHAAACSGEGCQSPPSLLPTFGPSASEAF